MAVHFTMKNLIPISYTTRLDSKYNIYIENCNCSDYTDCSHNLDILKVDIFDGNDHIGSKIISITSHKSYRYNIVDVYKKVLTININYNNDTYNIKCKFDRYKSLDYINNRPHKRIPHDTPLTRKRLFIDELF